MSVTTRPLPPSTSFSGFRTSGPGDVRIPAEFFDTVLPEITDLDEVRTALAIFQVLAREGNLEAPLAEARITRHGPLREAVRLDGIPALPSRETIGQALEALTVRGVLLRVEVASDRRSDRWYFLHTPVTSALVDAITRGDLAPPRAMWAEDSAPTVTIDPPTAFLLYEQNIGPLTPMVADYITRALQHYPLEWIEDAIGEAVAYNRRNWRYIQRILESWAADGRGDRA